MTIRLGKYYLDDTFVQRFANLDDEVYVIARETLGYENNLLDFVPVLNFALAEGIDVDSPAPSEDDWIDWHNRVIRAMWDTKVTAQIDEHNEQVQAAARERSRYGWQGRWRHFLFRGDESAHTTLLTEEALIRLLHRYTEYSVYGWIEFGQRYRFREFSQTNSEGIVFSQVQYGYVTIGTYDFNLKMWAIKMNDEAKVSFVEQEIKRIASETSDTKKQ